MLMRRLAVPFALAGLALAVGTGAQTLGQESGPFYCVTPHYEVATDVSPLFAQIVGRHMEAISERYAEYFQGYGKVCRRFRVSVHATQEGYWQEVPEELRGSTGAFVPARRLLAAHAEGRTSEEVLRTLYHEGLHQFIYLAVSPRCPLWLNEGLAEYFSEATWNGETFVLGEVPSVRLSALVPAIRDGTHVPFHRLFAMDIDQWIGGVAAGHDQADLLYSEVWSVAHFMATGDEGRNAPRLDRLLALISRGESADTALHDSFGPNLSLEAFEEAWKQHVLSLAPSPRFVCRDRMKAIMYRARRLYPNPRDFQSLKPLMESEVGRADPDAFRCPTSDDPEVSTFILLHEPAAGWPVLVCDAHPGVIVKAYYVPRPDGSIGVEVEEEVRELANPELLKRVEADAGGTE
jgi:hypothetical protein